MASPMPRLAPETKAILPSRSNRLVLDIAITLSEPGLKGGFADDLQGHLFQQLVHHDELSEALVLGLAMEEAVVDLLHDAGQAEQAVAVVEVEVVDADAGA